MRTADTYLDNASTSSPKPDCAWENARDFLAEIGVSPGRSGSRRARLADHLVEETRELLASLFNARQATHFAFAANATAALNTCIKGYLRSGDRVVTTVTEHNSVLRPLESLRRTAAVDYVTAVCDADGHFNLDWFENAISGGVRLVVVNHASNVTGAVAPVQEITRIAHQHSAAVLLDASQTAGIVDIDVDGWDLDMVAFTGHKCLLGPSGTGGMYIRDAATVRTVTEGGTGINSQSLCHPAVMPAKFEAGTLNYMGIAGLNAALKYLSGRHSEIQAHAAQILRRAIDGIEALPGVTVYTPAAELHHVPILSFNLAGLYASELAAVLDEHFRILTRAGLHCAPLVHQTLATAPHGTVRASFGPFNTDEDVDLLIEALSSIGADIGRFMS